MKKRVILLIVGAALLALAAAAPSPSASPSASPSSAAAPSDLRADESPSPSPSATPDPDAPPAGGWTLTLQGKLKRVLPIAKVKAKVAWHGELAGNINPTLRYTYKGQSLYKLIGLVDDKKGGFNVALAKKGYKIRFICRDGYKPEISSKRIIGKKKWIIAKRKAGKLLPGGEAPFRFVGSFIKPFNGKLSAYGIIRIRLIF